MLQLNSFIKPLLQHLSYTPGCTGPVAFIKLDCFQGAKQEASLVCQHDQCAAAETAQKAGERAQVRCSKLLLFYVAF